MTDPLLRSPAPDADRSPRLRLWMRLEVLHAQLDLEPPTATLTIAQLGAEVARLEQEAGSA